jgi:hypothetical protein
VRSFCHRIAALQRHIETSMASWRGLRQDDNDEAHRLAAELEARAHKQLYSAFRVEAVPVRPPPG